MRRIGFPLLLLLTACASKEVDKRIADSQRFERSLHVGATKEEIHAQGGDVANCRGSAMSYERCEVTFLSGEDPVLTGSWNSTNPSTGQAQNFSQDNNRTFVLHFKQGKLDRWEKSDAATLRSYP